MKKIIYSLILLLILISCEGNSRDHLNNTANIEEDLSEVINDDWDINSMISSKRYENDIIDNMYKNIKKNDDEIKLLHSKIENILLEKNQEVNLYHNYNNKITSYYSSANNILSQINNKELSELLSSIISKSETNYNREIQLIRDEIDNLAIEESDLNDYVNTLKVIKTIGFIEAYEEQEKSDIGLLTRIKSDIISLKNKIGEMIQ